jgi:DnaK suppressor protein
MNGSATDNALTTRHLAAFDTQLEQQRQFRVEQIQAHNLYSPEDRRSETLAEREIRETVFRGARAALAEIEAARRRLIEGSYGRCVDCGSSLPIERLEVLPSVALCVACHRAAAK